MLNYAAAFQRNRNFCCFKNRASHINRKLSHLVARFAFFHLKDFYSAHRLRSKLADTGISQALCVACIVNIFSNTADSVAAHLTSASIGIVHHHFKISLSTFFDYDDTVSADSKMTIRQLYGSLLFAFCSARKIFLCAIKINIVVSTTMHFCKLHNARFSV